MPEFRVTFGSQYPREPHPRFSLARRDGWVAILAVDVADARAFAVLVLGTAWCDLYADGRWESWDPGWFVEGELARFVTPLASGGPGAPVTEHALAMSGGGYNVRCDAPEVEAVYPVGDWVADEIRNGAHVFRRKVIVVDGWEELTGP